MFNNVDLIKNFMDGKPLFNRNVFNKKKQINDPQELYDNKSNNIKKTINRINKKNKVKLSEDKYNFCYVGKDNNKRVCAKINEDATCESNKIYPTLDLCINPNLK